MSPLPEEYFYYTEDELQKPLTMHMAQESAERFHCNSETSAMGPVTPSTQGPLPPEPIIDNTTQKLEVIATTHSP